MICYLLSLYTIILSKEEKKKGMQWLKGADWISVNPSMVMGQ
jgi:hypothetical protein